MSVPNLWDIVLFAALCKPSANTEPSMPVEKEILTFGIDLETSLKPAKLDV